MAVWKCTMVTQLETDLEIGRNELNILMIYFTLKKRKNKSLFGSLHMT